MKRNTILLVLVLLVVPLLLQSCGPSTKEIELTVQAGINQKNTQEALQEEQTAVANTQSAIKTEGTAMAMTQTAMAIPPAQAVTAASCPFYIYKDWGAEVNHFVPEGWMGDTQDIKLDDNYKLDPEHPTVIQITYKPSGDMQWAGVYWWDPPGSFFGSKDGGFDLSCATKLTFWARGENGGEKAEFKAGGIAGTFRDSLQPALSSGPITLTNSWVQYTIGLSGKDLSHVIGGFVWVTNKPQNPNGAVIYMDDILYEH